jgi:hypothetical protein
LSSALAAEQRPGEKSPELTILPDSRSDRNRNQ